MDVADSAVFLAKFDDVAYLIDIQAGNGGEILSLDGIDVKGIGGEFRKVIIGFLKGDSGTFAVIFKQILQIPFPRLRGKRQWEEYEKEEGPPPDYIIPQRISLMLLQRRWPRYRCHRPFQGMIRALQRSQGACHSAGFHL